MPSQGGSHVEIVISSGLGDKGVSLVRETVDVVIVAVIPKAAGRRLSDGGRVQGERGGQCEHEQCGSYQTPYHFSRERAGTPEMARKNSITTGPGECWSNVSRNNTSVATPDDRL